MLFLTFGISKSNLIFLFVETKVEAFQEFELVWQKVLYLIISDVI